MKLIVFIVALAGLTSCALVTDISEDALSKKLLGQAYLNQSVTICSIASEDIPVRSLPTRVMYSGDTECSSGKKNHGLVKGAGLSINKLIVREAYSIMSVKSWYFVGEYNLEDHNMMFYYHYGLGSVSDPEPNHPKDLPWILKE